jgi:hypothetical protein
MRRNSVNIFILLLLTAGILFAEKQKESETYFNKATITVETENPSRKYFKFKAEDLFRFPMRTS